MQTFVWKFIIKIKTKDSVFHTLLPRQKASCTGLTGDMPAWHFSRPSAPPSGEEKNKKRVLTYSFQQYGNMQTRRKTVGFLMRTNQLKSVELPGDSAPCWSLNSSCRPRHSCWCFPEALSRCAPPGRCPGVGRWRRTIPVETPWTRSVLQGNWQTWIRCV